MSDAAYTARHTNREVAHNLITKLPFDKDENGQYKHDDAIKFIGEIKRKLGEMFNLLDPANGMAALAGDGDNDINSIKSTSVYLPSDILKVSKKEAEDESKKTGQTVAPEITTRQDAQEEADRKNQYSQAVIGVKEGVTEALEEIFGTDATDIVLKTADGSSRKGIDEYKLHQLFDAIITGANRPKAPSILNQFIGVRPGHAI